VLRVLVNAFRLRHPCTWGDCGMEVNSAVTRRGASESRTGENQFGARMHLNRERARARSWAEVRMCRRKRRRSFLDDSCNGSCPIAKMQTV
jgi:hypothetical protein